MESILYLLTLTMIPNQTCWLAGIPSTILSSVTRQIRLVIILLVTVLPDLSMKVGVMHLLSANAIIILAQEKPILTHSLARKLVVVMIIHNLDVFEPTIALVGSALSQEIHVPITLIVIITPVPEARMPTNPAPTITSLATLTNPNSRFTSTISPLPTPCQTLRQPFHQIMPTANWLSLGAELQIQKQPLLAFIIISELVLHLVQTMSSAVIMPEPAIQPAVTLEI